MQNKYRLIRDRKCNQFNASVIAVSETLFLLIKQSANACICTFEQSAPSNAHTLQNKQVQIHYTVTYDIRHIFIVHNNIHIWKLSLHISIFRYRHQSQLYYLIPHERCPVLNINIEHALNKYWYSKKPLIRNYSSRF